MDTMGKLQTMHSWHEGADEEEGPGELTPLQVFNAILWVAEEVLLRLRVTGVLALGKDELLPEELIVRAIGNEPWFLSEVFAAAYEQQATPEELQAGVEKFLLKVVERGSRYITAQILIHSLQEAMGRSLYPEFRYR